MKKFKQIVTLLLAAALCISVSACTAQKTCDDNKGIIMTIGERGVRTDEFMYYLLAYKQQCLASDAEYFNADATRFPQALTQLEQNLIYETALINWAADNGVVLNDEDYEAVQSEITKQLAAETNKNEFRDKLAENGETMAVYRLMLERELLNNKIGALLNSDENPVKVSDEELQTYADELGMLGAKHILILSADDDEAARQKADGILARIRAGEDFDELMNEYSEDTGLEYNPDGYSFKPTDMVHEFTAGTQALALEEISGLIKTEYGYHIIKRIEPDLAELEYEMTMSRLSDIIREYADDITVTHCDDYDAMTIDDITFKGPTED